MKDLFPSIVFQPPISNENGLFGEAKCFGIEFAKLIDPRFYFTVWSLQAPAYDSVNETCFYNESHWGRGGGDGRGWAWTENSCRAVSPQSQLRSQT